MSNKNIISLTEKTNNGGYDSPQQLIDRFKEELKGSELKDVKKAIVLYLDDSEGGYSIGFRQCGMKMSEIVSLLEVAKSLALEEMGF